MSAFDNKTTTTKTAAAAAAARIVYLAVLFAFAQRHVGLAGGGSSQQVVDVDAPLEHHHAGAGRERIESAGLPGRSPAGDEDDRRGHPRTATETSGSVRLPSSP